MNRPFWKRIWMLPLLLCLIWTVQGCYAIVPIINFGELNIDKEFGLLNTNNKPDKKTDGKAKSDKPTVKELMK